MADTVARTPVSSANDAPVPEAQNPDRPKNGESEVPIALYEDLKGMPYSAEFFEVQEIWNNDNLTLKEDLGDIESYYKDLVQRGEIKDGKESFKKVVKEAESITNSIDSPIPVKIAKIAVWAKFMNQMGEITRRASTYTL